MSATIPTFRSPATVEDLLALPGDLRVELIAGQIVEKAAPTLDHGASQKSTGAELHRISKDSDPNGGWWIGNEVDVQYTPRYMFRHDLVGWRRNRVPIRPKERPVLIRPDWVYEILSPSNWSNDTVVKSAVQHRAGVPHYWIIDLEHGAITVLRWDEDTYQIVAEARSGERRRLEPFEELELEIDDLLAKPAPPSKV